MESQLAAAATALPRVVRVGVYDAIGRALDSWNVGRVFHELQTAAGLPFVRVHDLRRTQRLCFGAGRRLTDNHRDARSFADKPDAEHLLQTRGTHQSSPRNSQTLTWDI